MSVTISRNNISSSNSVNYISCVHVGLPWGVSAGSHTQISDNIFDSATTGENMVNMVGACYVHNNKFIRGSTSINYYIVASIYSNSKILDNFFDQTTTNGTNENLINPVSSFPYSSGNTNQIMTTYLPYNITQGNSVGLNFYTGAASYYIDQPTGTPGGNKFTLSNDIGYFSNIIQNANATSTTISKIAFVDHLPRLLTNCNDLVSISVDFIVESDGSTLTSGPSNIYLAMSDGTNVINSNGIPLNNDAAWQASKGVTKTWTITNFSNIDWRTGAVVITFTIPLGGVGIVTATTQGRIKLSAIKVKYKI